MPASQLKFAPRKIFEQILSYAVIPTFDLIVYCDGHGVVLLRRRIAPYKGSWALPGLRMMKPEGIDDTLARIAASEIGVRIDPREKRFVGQYVGRFQTENRRQDLSTCYAVRLSGQEIAFNPEHFSGMRYVKSVEDIPGKTGAMYRYYLDVYFSHEFSRMHTNDPSG